MYKVFLFLLLIKAQCFLTASGGLSDWQSVLQASQEKVIEGQYVEGHKLAQQAYNLATTENKTSINQAVALTLAQLSHTSMLVGHYNTADSLSNILQRQTLELYGTEAEEHIESIMLGAQIATYRDNYSKADSLYHAVQPFVEELSDSTRAKYLDAYGLFLLKTEQFQAADSVLVESLQLKKQLNGSNHRETAYSIYLLGKLQLDKQQYILAEENLETALNVFTTTLPSNHPLLALVHNHLGFFHSNQSNFSIALEHLQEARAIWEAQQLTQHQEYASVLNHLGMVQIEIGNYNLAKTNLDSALIINQQFYPHSIEEAFCLVHLSDLNRTLQKFEPALELNERACSIFEEKQFFLDLALATSKRGLCYDYAAFYEEIPAYYEKADSFYRRSIDILATKGYTYSIQHAIALDSYASFLINQEKYDEATKLQSQALELVRNLLGTQNKTYATILSNMGFLFDMKGDFDQAEQYYLQAKQVEDKQGNTKHPDYVKLLYNLAGFYYYWEHPAEATKYYREANQLYLEQIYNVFVGADEITRDRFLQNTGASIEQFFSFATQPGAPADLASDVQNIRLATKNLSLDYSIDLKESVKRAAKSELYEEWLEVRKKLARAYQVSQEKRQREGWDIESLQTEAVKLEQQLGQHNEKLKRQFSYNNKIYTAKELIQKLQPGEAAIDIFAFEFFDGAEWTDSVKYYAVVSRSGFSNPLIVPLVERMELKGILNTPDDKGTVPMDYIRSAAIGFQLYQTAWKPVEEQLAGVKKIYFSPEGLFHRISMMSLPVNEEGTEHLADRYEFSYCNDLRTIFKVFKTVTPGASRSSLIVGGVNYSTEPTKGNEEQIAYTSRFGRYFAPLLFSKEEADSISFQMKTKNWKVKKMIDVEPSEENLKKFLVKNNAEVIHLATHGFYFKPPEGNQQSDENLRVILQSAYPPLLRSGIALAGANRSWKDGESNGNEEDGILTALEVSNLDMFGTRLVVLSACESAKGDIENVEGVFGLQRGFQLAGAEQLLVSLWLVDDAATAALMQLFYKNYLAGKSASDALAQAQRTMKKDVRFQNAELWGAFIIIE